MYFLFLSPDIFLESNDAATVVKTNLEQRSLWEECCVEGCSWEEIVEVYGGAHRHDQHAQVLANYYLHICNKRG